MVIDVSELVQPVQVTAKQRGRPRSADRHHAILRSTRALLVSGGYEQLTIEAIAAGAGVSKQTVYKWWPSKAAVVAEAVMAGYLSVASDPPADSGDLAADLGEWLLAQIEAMEDPTALALVRAMIVATAEGSTDAERLYAQMAQPHRQYMLRRLAAAARQGQLRADADLDAAVEAIFGALVLRTLARTPANTASSADGLIDIVLNGITAPQSTPRRRGRA